jgi:ABC-2 type transport system ATP-binding protein
MNKLTLNGVNKHYGTKHALIDFDYEFTDGVYGLLGPNGAGKSTMMNIITQNIPCDSDSEILWNGKDINKLQENYRKRIGFMPQQQELYPSFTASRFIGYIAALKGIKREKIDSEIDRVLELVELSDQADQKLGGFSGGMKQRVLIAQALLGNPKLLVLDEPTAGLDPKQRVITRNLISGLSKDKIVIISTHIVSDIETIADRILLIKEGLLIDEGTVPELCAKVEGEHKNLESLYMQYYGDE